jgi:acetate kinase
MISTILTVNEGSSSLKFKLFNADTLEILWLGKVTGITSANGNFNVTDGKDSNIVSQKLRTNSESKAISILIEWIQSNLRDYEIKGIGHRVVHGGNLFFEPAIITPLLLKVLKKVENLAPLHLPDAVGALSIFLKAFPDTLQVASFDTDFHKDLPDHAKFYPLPASIRKKGVQRYGFHGLSCQYIIKHLEQKGENVMGKKMLIAHLGSGSSLTAVLDGKSVDTTMGFTPAAGLIMSSRTGDIDPGIASFLIRSRQLSGKDLDELFNKKSGLLGISGKTGDISGLLEKEQSDPASALAVQMYCYSVKKAIGQFAAVMNGVDELIFTGGIGENVPVIRQRICSEMDFLGIYPDLDLNLNNETEIISRTDSRVRIRLIAANEEYILASNVKAFL